jgi:PIN domain nuclease of toxin-antitoxin system
VNSDTPLAAVCVGEQRASICEIAIKSSLRRKDFRIDLGQLLATLPEIGPLELPITAVTRAGVARLPAIHRDPFDRLLIAQSLVEPLTLLINVFLTRPLSSRRAGGIIATCVTALRGCSDCRM